MKPVWTVARREFLERVRSRGFIIGTVALPLVVLILIGASAALGSRGQQARRNIALVDFTGYLGERVRTGLESSGYQVEVVPRDGVDGLDGRVADGEFFGYLLLDDLTLEEGAAVFRGKEPPGTLSEGLIRATIVQSALAARLRGTGDGRDADALLRGGSLEFESTSGESSAEDLRAATIAGFVGAMLLYMSMLVYGTFVMRSVLEEKRNRVVEVVISSIRPWQLMLGKILGVGAVGLAQLTIWALAFLLILLLALPNLVAMWPLLDELGDMSRFVPGVGTVALFGTYFLLGYFLYSSLFAAVGAICTREEEAQQVQFPIIMLLVFPLILQTSTLEGNGFPWLDWAAVFPFFSPILMFPRAVAGLVPGWMVALSIVLMILALVGTAWVAGRIYRVGILMQGKRPTLPQILRWVREAD
ncbi:MAG: ABC transporter permease [Gemmatimonadota bacterium]|nr:ABC transporter permease [Gemmatimonadota bacterium]